MRIWLLPVTALLLADASRATVVSVPSLEEMSISSEVIAEVVVGDAVVERDHGRIVTKTAVAVVDGWKGAKTGETFALWQLGGNLGDRAGWITGAKHFAKGEHLVLFADHHVNGPVDELVPFGIGFGSFTVAPPADGASASGPVVEDVGDVVELTKTGSQVPAVRRYASLESFKALVLRALALEELPHARTLQRLGPQLVRPKEVK
jgi:hypothetical protein